MLANHRSLVWFSRTKKHLKRQRSVLKTRAPRQTTATSSWVYLLESFLFYLVILSILKFISPRAIANVPLTDAYLPFHLPLFMANSLLLFGILKNWRQAVVLAITFETLLFFKLQLIELSWQVVGAIGLIPSLMLAFDLYNRRKVYA